MATTGCRVGVTPTHGPSVTEGWLRESEAEMISVLLVESHAAVRDAFATMFNMQEDFTVVATASSVREAINLAWVHQPDIALIDMQLPNDSGFHMIEQLRSSVPHCRCVLLTSNDLQGYRCRAYEYGAWAYLSKELSFADIVGALEQVHDGKRLIDPRVICRENHSPLTNRETDVLRMVARMGTTAEISKVMHLSPGTINNYVSSIMSKLGASNRVQALIIARENGWI
ncbi:MAG: response regulator transcription factor [Propionibacteriaceae bacterium]|jgi:two-component system response regulator DesR|nr:response regulator transcription factor [Propionibacteriaceae bacterium]